MAGPYLTIDLDKIEHNARTIVRLCRAHGIAVTGVTKAVCGDPEIARAMLRGGVATLADSRMENLRRLACAGLGADCMLLRLPPLSGVDDVVASVAVSLNSEISVLSGLSRAACRLDRVHDVIVMIDLGDLREGIWPAELMALVRHALQLPGIRLVGLGTNLACFAGVLPSAENMGRLVAHAHRIEQTFGLTLRWISGVNSSGLELIASGRMPKRVNHARVGEAILLGRETGRRRPWPDTFQDAFTLHAEVLEQKIKPSVPIGARGEDAFGGHPAFVDQGDIARALLNVGREDVDITGLTPRDPRIAILGASSGYLVVDASGVAEGVEVGDELAFSLNYGALLRTMVSAYVEKRSCHGSVGCSGGFAPNKAAPSDGLVP